MRIFDCTTYYDEELMMDIRFNTLNDQVEKFIVVESLFSHSGNKKKLNFDIEVDGGVNFSNSKDILKAGANILVSGTTVFKENNGDIKKNIETLKLV